MPELTPEIRERRVAVAGDVIAQIDAKATRISKGNYIRSFAVDEDGFRSAYNPIPAIKEAQDQGGDLRDHLGVIQEHCEVCAIGAAVLSKARLYDGVPFSEIDSGYGGLFNVSDRDCYAALADVFDPVTQDMIEAAFERSVGLARRTTKDSHFDGLCRADAFGSRYDELPDRCRAIYANIIENDGEFLP
jgi:hypothetical protein